MKYNVIEIFDSVQGEGVNLGKQCTFIRLAGCNLSCPWCDTNVNPDRTEILDELEIFGRVHHRLVVITGGEPTLYDLMPLLSILHDNGKKVWIETNGTLPLNQYEGLFQGVSCSPKPEAGFKIVPDNAPFISEIKLVVDESVTADLVKLFVSRYPNAILWLQPEAFNFEVSVGCAQELLKVNPRVRLGIQAHKVWEVR